MPIVKKHTYQTHAGYFVTLTQRSFDHDPNGGYSFELVITKASTGTEKRAIFYVATEYEKDLCDIIALSAEYTYMIIKAIEQFDELHPKPNTSKI